LKEKIRRIGGCKGRFSRVYLTLAWDGRHPASNIKTAPGSGFARGPAYVQEKTTLIPQVCYHHPIGVIRRTVWYTRARSTAKSLRMTSGPQKWNNNRANPRSGLAAGFRSARAGNGLPRVLSSNPLMFLWPAARRADHHKTEDRAARPSCRSSLLLSLVMSMSESVSVPVPIFTFMFMFMFMSCSCTIMFIKSRLRSWIWDLGGRWESQSHPRCSPLFCSSIASGPKGCCSCSPQYLEEGWWCCSACRIDGERVFSVHKSGLILKIQTG
jgi:hypothetical protein